jgi:hypothetical protein
MIQAALCLILSPLLAAHQVAAEAQQQAAEPVTPEAANTLALYATLDFVKGRKIQLVAQEPVSIEMAQTGAPFQFVVDKDVAVDGVTLIHAGTPVTGVIAKVNRGSYERSRDGYLDLRLSAPAGGKPVLVRLGGVPPQPVYRMAVDNPPNNYFDQFLRTFQIAGAVVGFFFLLMILIPLI